MVSACMGTCLFTTPPERCPPYRPCEPCGSGDEYAIVFSPAGAYIRGFDHESPLTPYHHEDVPAPWPGVVDSVPEPFRRYVDEPAFTDEDGTPVVTVCLWRGTADERGVGRAGRRGGRNDRLSPRR